MPEIQLAKDNIILLFDDVDYEKAKQYHWLARKERSGSYSIRTQIKGIRYPLAELIFHVPKGKMIFHKNGNKFDFRRSEITIATRQEYFHLNSSNSGESSKFRRVLKVKTKNPWQVSIEKDGIIFGGRYEEEEEAAIAADYLAVTLYKDFSNKNFPELSIEELTVKYNELLLKYGKNKTERNSKAIQGVTRRTTKTSSDFVGVYWNKRQKKWVAEIIQMRKRYWLGLFDNEEDAAQAYDKKAIELFGDFARTNFQKGTK